MSLPEALGFLASGLVLLTFGMRTMLPMRLLATLSNLAFITYGLSLGLTPVWVLHGILLPLNVYRLHELQRNRCPLPAAAQGGRSLERLRPRVANAGSPAARSCSARASRPVSCSTSSKAGSASATSTARSTPPTRKAASASPRRTGRASRPPSARPTASSWWSATFFPTPTPTPIRPQPIRQKPAERRLPDLASFLHVAAWAQRRSG